MSFYSDIFSKLLQEDNFAGAGGAFGDASSMGFGGAVGNTDFWNTGDTRIAKGGKKKSEKFKPCSHCTHKSKCSEAGKCLQLSKEKNYNGSIETLIPMQKRPFSVDGLN